VNIAQMTVGRQLPGGEAIAVLNLDSPPPEEALQEVRAHPQISSLSVVKLPPAGEMPKWFVCFFSAVGNFAAAGRVEGGNGAGQNWQPLDRPPRHKPHYSVSPSFHTRQSETGRNPRK
jgi:hypothetical protein